MDILWWLLTLIVYLLVTILAHSLCPGHHINHCTSQWSLHQRLKYDPYHVKHQAVLRMVKRAQARLSLNVARVCGPPAIVTGSQPVNISGVVPLSNLSQIKLWVQPKTLISKVVTWIRIKIKVGKAYWVQESTWIWLLCLFIYPSIFSSTYPL